MKISTNQALKDVNQAFSDLVRAIAHIIFVIPASKLKVMFDSIDTFPVEMGIDLKKCFKVTGIVLFILANVFIFSKLFGRALDIEAGAQEMVMIEYKESLKDMDAGE